MLVAARHSKLEESIKLHQYIRDADDVLSWISDKQQTASSEEYGKDFEHLLVSDASLGGTTVVHSCLVLLHLCTGTAEEV